MAVSEEGGDVGVGGGHAGGEEWEVGALEGCVGEEVEPGYFGEVGGACEEGDGAEGAEEKGVAVWWMEMLVGDM